jgi:hypothetical protein
MIEFAEIIDDIDKMPYESQEILVDIINKRFSEKKRERFINDTLESNQEYNDGHVQSGNSSDLFNKLNIKFS